MCKALDLMPGTREKKLSFAAAVVKPSGPVEAGGPPVVPPCVSGQFI